MSKVYHRAGAVIDYVRGQQAMNVAIDLPEQIASNLAEPHDDLARAWRSKRWRRKGIATAS